MRTRPWMTIVGAFFVAAAFLWMPKAEAAPAAGGGGTHKQAAAVEKQPEAAPGASKNLSSPHCDRLFSIKTKSGICMALAGKLELEFVDMEGAGGFENQQGADRTLIDNRSPHFQLDKFVLNPRIYFSRYLSTQAELRFEQSETFVESATINAELPDIAGRLKGRFEFGLQEPFVKPDRRTEIYPLIGRSVWRRSEFHVTYEGSFSFADDRVDLFWGAVIAQMRPLTWDDVAEDSGQIDILQYGQARLTEGIDFGYGGKAGLRLVGAELMYFGFKGQLSNRYDMDVLINELTGYSNLGNRYKDTFYWHGGRFTFDRWNAYLIGEIISSQEGELKRRGFYAQASYRIRIFKNQDIPFHTVEPLFRYGQLNLTNLPAAASDPHTWDHENITLALLSNLFRDYILLKIEYYFLRETTGSAKIRNNEILAQLRVQF